jgi:hypothetical protein
MRGSTSKIKEYQKCCDEGLVLRVQENWAFDTICGWAKISYISPPGTPADVVTPRVLLESGCGHMTKDEYIATFLTDKKTGEVFADVVSIHFEKCWTREGCPIPNMNPVD